MDLDTVHLDCTCRRPLVRHCVHLRLEHSGEFASGERNVIICSFFSENIFTRKFLYSVCTSFRICDNTWEKWLFSGFRVVFGYSCTALQDIWCLKFCNVWCFRVFPFTKAFGYLEQYRQNKPLPYSFLFINITPKSVDVFLYPNPAGNFSPMFCTDVESGYSPPS